MAIDILKHKFNCTYGSLSLYLSTFRKNTSFTILMTLLLMMLRKNVQKYAINALFKNQLMRMDEVTNPQIPCKYPINMFLYVNKG